MCLSIAAISDSRVSNCSDSSASRVTPSSAALVMMASMSAALATRVASNSAICSAMVFMSLPSSGFGDLRDLVRVAEAPAGVTRTTGTALRPNAASCCRSRDLMVLMVASTLHGTVTSESS
ncbi:hypothetical protein D3C85_1224280 [compost metagenome]